MIVKTHLIPIKKTDSNKGSCGGICAYLNKEKAYFFDQNINNISLDAAVLKIDNHSKGRLGKDESKWYSPMYAFSQEECEHVVLLLFNKRYQNYTDLSEEEKDIYNEYIVLLARQFQDQMAINFGKDDLGIIDGNDLVYVGVVENSRKFDGYDLNLKGASMLKKDNLQKTGFNTHVHIVQSRKANNLKQSKISPEAVFKSRKTDNFNNNSRAGFDRNKFYNLIEETFDRATKYNRDPSQSFEFRKMESKVAGKSKSKEMININTKPKEKIKPMAKTKFYTKEEVDNISNNTSLVNYFFSLADRGILKFEQKRGNDYIFNNLNQKSGSISVSEQKGWNNFNGDKGGHAIKAVQTFESLPWRESVQFLEENKGFDNYEFKNNDVAVSIQNADVHSKSTVNILSSEPVTNKYILSYFKSRGISEDVIKNNVKQINYQRGDKTYCSGGIENIKGSFNVRSQNFKGIIGDHNDISVIAGSSKSCLIFEGLVDYLSYLELTDQNKLDETTIILNSTSNLESTLNFIDTNSFDRVGILTNGDQAGDLFAKSVTKKYGEKATDLRYQFDISDKVDLNDRLIIEQVKSVSKKGYGM